MIDAEISRLRRLRDAALGTRALARALNPTGSDPAMTHAAMLCWSIAKIAAGRLRAHPYPEYQRDQSAARRRWDDVCATIEAPIARRLRREHQTLAGDLQSVARELDRSRALSRLQDLSDAFGRMQLRMRAVQETIARRARTSEQAVRTAMDRADQGSEAAAVGSAMPYLSLSGSK